MRLAFIGGGAMAEAIIKSVTAEGIATGADISVGEPVPARADFLCKNYGVFATDNNAEAAGKGDIIVLSVKPQDLAEAASQIRSALDGDQTIVSIIAGARMDTLFRLLEHDKVIRVMPNTPAQIGQGMSVWTCSPQTDDLAREQARSILAAMGDEIMVSDEKYLEMATALSASGPAYVFMFIESLIDAGVYLGLPRPMARTLALQTVLGSASLVKETGRHPADLKDMVSSPGGTTVEALMTLEDAGFRAAVLNAVVAAHEKSLALGE